MDLPPGMDDLARAVRALGARRRPLRLRGGARSPDRIASCVAAGRGARKNRGRGHVGRQGGSARCDDGSPARINWSWSGRAPCGGRTCPSTSATASASTSAISCSRPRLRRGPPRHRRMSSEKIHPEHLGRPAFVYVRQSTFDQVRHHHESRRRQYDLQGHARTLGWTSGGRDRRGSGQVGRHRGGPHRLSAPGGRGEPGPRGRRLRARGLATGAQQSRLVSAPRSVRADEHADRGRGRRLRPSPAQRSAAARLEGHDQRGGAGVDSAARARGPAREGAREAP